MASLLAFRLEVVVLLIANLVDTWYVFLFQVLCVVWPGQ